MYPTPHAKAFRVCTTVQRNFLLKTRLLSERVSFSGQARSSFEYREIDHTNSKEHPGNCELIRKINRSDRSSY